MGNKATSEINSVAKFHKKLDKLDKIILNKFNAGECGPLDHNCVYVNVKFKHELNQYILQYVREWNITVSPYRDIVPTYNTMVSSSISTKPHEYAERCSFTELNKYICDYINKKHVSMFLIYVVANDDYIDEELRILSIKSIAFKIK